MVIQLAPNQFQNERTGRVYATAALAIAIDGDDTAWSKGVGVAVTTAPIKIEAYDNAGNIIGAYDTRARDIYGNLVTNQTQSSQYWMNAGYTGEDPTYAEKLYADDAMRAYNNAVNIAVLAAQTNPQVSSGIRTLAASEPQQQSYTPSPTTTAALPDLAAYFSPLIQWASKNALYIIGVIAAIYILPLLIPAPSRRRS